MKSGNGFRFIQTMFFEIIAFFKITTVKGFYAEDPPDGAADKGNRPDYTELDEDGLKTLDEWGMKPNDDIKNVKAGKGTDGLTDDERAEMEEAKKEKAKTPEQKQKEIDDKKALEDAANEGKTPEQIQKEKDDKAAEEKKDKEKPSGETVKIGKTIVPMEEYEELVKMAKVHYGEGFDKLPEDMMEKVLEDRYNLKQGSNKLNEKNRQAAEERKTVEEMKTDLEAQKVQHEADKKAFEDEIERVKAAKIKAQAVIDSKVKDEFNEEEVIDLKISKSKAKTDLEALENYEKAQKTELEKTIDRIKAEDADLTNKLNITKLQEMYPELRTKTPIAKLWVEYNATDGEGMDEKDLARMLRVQTTLEGYYKKRAGGSIENYYKLLRHNLPVIEDTEIKEEKKGEPKSVKQAFKELAKKQAENKGSMGGDTGGGHGAEIDTDQKFRKATGWE